MGVAGSTARGGKPIRLFLLAIEIQNWLLVAFGMIGTTLSGVTFVSGRAR